MAVLQEKTTARVKKGVAYYEGEAFTISNIDKVKTIDLSRYTGYAYSRSDNDLIISHYGTCITIKDYFGANGTVASTVKTLRIYDNGQKKGYKDYNLTTSGLLNHIDSGVENFAIKKGVITGTAFADTISAEDFNKPTGKKKNVGVTIKTGLGNDNVTGSVYNDTFNITGSGEKTINIGSNDGDDTIKGINTNGVSLNLNISNTVSKYERTGNDLKITANGEETSTTTTIKDYFKNTTTAPYIRINGNSLLGNLNNTELVNIDRSAQTKKQTIKGTFLNDKITGSKKADKITTGYGTDIIQGGLGNDKIIIDAKGSKYIIMNPNGGVDTVTSKVNDYIYLQFKGANIINDTTAKSNLTYEKSGKNDLKITSTVEASAIIAPTGYISNTGIDTDKISYYYSCASGSYYTQITEDTGLYSYETDGETRYTTEKNATVKLDTAKLIQTRNRYTEVVDSAGFLTTSTNYSASTDDYIVTDLSNEETTTLYAYKSKTYTGIYEYVYSTKNNVAIKYSDLWLKKPYSDSNYYVFTTEKENDDCIQVSSLDKIYHWYDSVKLESTSDTYEEITNDKFDSIYYIDKNHTYIADIDNNNTTPIYKEFDISSSYYLKCPNSPYYSANNRGMAVTTALTENSYKKIDNIYKTTDDEGKVVLSLDKPENFKEDISSTSVIIKDYLTKEQSVLITNSDNTSSARWLSSILYDIGVNIGNANSKKAQKLTGSKFNDNIYGGSGKDKITTGASNSWNRGDIITPGKGNDTITINGNGNKTINIANADGNDTIIFTDNNKKTKYDYTTNKMLYLNFDDDASLSYSMKGKDLIINRSYANGTKTAAATTTLKDYFNVDYRYQLASNIVINNETFYAPDYFDNSTIDKTSGKKSQKINGNMFNNTIIGGSANDTINGGGGSDILDGGSGSDTYVVNYLSGSKYYYSDKIVISDTGTGAKDIDTLKLDVKKKDLGLLFNISKITNPNAYTDNDIVVGSGNDAIHYLMDNQWMIVTNFSSLDDVEIISDKVKMEHGIFATGLEKITTSDKKNITLANIKTIAQDVANWLSTANNGAGYDSTAAVYANGSNEELITMLSKYNPDNASIKQYINAG